MLARQIGMSAGTWLRAGMAGTIVGLDWRAVDVLLPPRCDKAAVTALLRDWEAGMLEGVAETATKQ